MSNYTIVSFCGGGFRGLLSAGVLARLAVVNPAIVTGTNLFAGTSTGSGIISLLTAKQTPEDIVNYFLNEEAKFFQNPGTDPQHPAYDVIEVAVGVERFHGLKKLSSLGQSVLFTAFDIGEDKVGWKPVLFSNLNDTSGTTIADAVTSSSAMPGMLGSYKNHIDGAFVNHDPTIAAIAIAMSTGVAIEDIAVICIGTGFMPNWIASDASTWGAEQWMHGDHNPLNHVPPLLVNGPHCPVLNATLNGTSTNLTPKLASMMLGGRYVHINPQIPYLAENDVSQHAIDTLQKAATNASIGAATTLLGTYWPQEGAPVRPAR